jgi:protein-S-isoprenylcysteine O-methyltransferase Ste14
MVWRIGAAGRRSGIAGFGSPPISKPAFYLAKIAMVLSIFLLALEAAADPPRLSVAAGVLVAVLLISGTLVCAAGLSQLGSNLRVGLPREETALVSGGIYSYTRNPIYVGIYAVLAASLIYAFSWLNLLAVVLTMVTHHRIVLAEERFLARRFKAYNSYRMRVRRYL